MRTIEATKLAVSLLAPPRCGICAAPCRAPDPVCGGCAAALAGLRGGASVLPGVGPVSWAAPYEGIARELVAEFKFGARLGLAELAAAAVADAVRAPPGAVVVAVPPAPNRLRRRGFDAAALIAAALARRVGLDAAQPLRRASGPRQVGRRRSERLARPPQVHAVGPAPRRVILVDDVLTTGATLASCAAALRRAGGCELSAAVFARALGPGCGAA